MLSDNNVLSKRLSRTAESRHWCDISMYNIPIYVPKVDGCVVRIYHTLQYGLWYYNKLSNIIYGRLYGFHIMYLYEQFFFFFCSVQNDPKVLFSS